MTETRNPWNFIIPTLKVSVTKVRGFFDLRECNFQTSFHIRGNKMMKIRGDRNAKSLKFYYTSFKSCNNKSSRIFWSETLQFSNLFSHWGQQNDENKTWHVKSLKFYYTTFKSFSNKSSRIFWFERMQFSNLFSHWGQQNVENKTWPKCEILEILLYHL